MTVNHAPKSPTSPTSAATSAHPLNYRSTPQTTQLQLVTALPLDSAHGRYHRASLTTIPSSPQTNPTNTLPTATNNSANEVFPSPISTVTVEHPSDPLPPIDTAVAAEPRRHRQHKHQHQHQPQTNPTITDSDDPTLPRSPALVPPPPSSSSWTSAVQTPYPARPADYRAAIARISTPLVPLISVTTGLAHPLFPRTLLQFYLLTHDQLDSLARWYHQVSPAVEETWKYPAWIPPFTSPSSSSSSECMTMMTAAAATQTYCKQPLPSVYHPSHGFEHVTLETKRRRWGRFIGFQGCESPSQDGDGEGGALAERMERDWRNAMRTMRELEVLREKEWGERW